MYGNGKHALADAMDIVTTELERLIDRHFGANRTLVVEPEGSKWVASIGDAVLYRSPDRAATIRFAWAFQEKTPGTTVEIVHTITQHSVRVDNVVPIGGAA